MSTYRNAKRDVAVANDFLADQLPCAICRSLANHTDLAAYGARCFDCYRAYCGQGRYFPPLSKAERQAMADTVRTALRGGTRPAPREHIAHLAGLVAAGTASAGQRAFMAGLRAPAAADAGAVAVAPIGPDRARVFPPSDLAAEPPTWTTEDVEEPA